MGVGRTSTASLLLSVPAPAETTYVVKDVAGHVAFPDASGGLLNEATVTIEQGTLGISFDVFGATSGAAAFEISSTSSGTFESLPSGMEVSGSLLGDSFGSAPGAQGILTAASQGSGGGGALQAPQQFPPGPTPSVGGTSWGYKCLAGGGILDHGNAHTVCGKCASVPQVPDECYAPFGVVFHQPDSCLAAWQNSSCSFSPVPAVGPVYKPQPPSTLVCRSGSIGTWLGLTEHHNKQCCNFVKDGTLGQSDIQHCTSVAW